VVAGAFGGIMGCGYALTMWFPANLAFSERDDITLVFYPRAVFFFLPIVIGVFVGFRHGLWLDRVRLSAITAFGVVAGGVLGYAAGFQGWVVFGLPFWDPATPWNALCRWCGLCGVGIGAIGGLWIGGWVTRRQRSGIVSPASGTP
jgi:hypothetical protein